MKNIIALFLVLISSTVFAQQPWEEEATIAREDCYCMRMNADNYKGQVNEALPTVASKYNEAAAALTAYEAIFGPQPTARTLLANGNDARTVGISCYNTGVSYYNSGDDSMCIADDYWDDLSYFLAYTNYDMATIAYNLSANKFYDSRESFNSAIYYYQCVINLCAGA